jgi:hypothetical protein
VGVQVSTVPSDYLNQNQVIGPIRLRKMVPAPTDKCVQLADSLREGEELSESLREGERKSLVPDETS